MPEGGAAGAEVLPNSSRLLLDKLPKIRNFFFENAILLSGPQVAEKKQRNRRVFVFGDCDDLRRSKGAAYQRQDLNQQRIVAGDLIWV